jgi:hypothetical protein
MASANAGWGTCALSPPPPRTRLMAYLRPLRRLDMRQRLGHHGVQALRAEAAAEYQQPRAARAPGEASRGFGKGRNVGAHRIAHGVCVHGGSEAAGKCLHHLPGHFGQPAIRQPGNGILLVDQQGHAQQPRRDAAGTAHVAARAQHGTRFQTAHDGHGLQHGAQDSHRRHGPGADSLAANALDGHPLDGKPVGRHQTCFHAVRHTQPHHGNTAVAQFLRDGQRGEHVAARAARHDEHRRAAGLAG